MALPALYNPVIKQGLPFLRTLTITDDAGAAFDLTNATCKGSVRNTDGAIVSMFAFTITAPATGVVQFGITDTSVLPLTNGLHSLPYDIVIIPDRSPKFSPLEGLICVEQLQTDLT